MHTVQNRSEPLYTANANMLLYLQTKLKFQESSGWTMWALFLGFVIIPKCSHQKCQKCSFYLIADKTETLWFLESILDFNSAAWSSHSRLTPRLGLRGCYCSQTKHVCFVWVNHSYRNLDELNNCGFERFAES